MKWKIGDKYTITSDATCFTVNEIRTYTEKSPKAGQTYESPLTYHGTLEQACQSLLDREIMLSHIETDRVMDMIREIDEIKREIIGAIRG